jgi:hypothetical protein
VPVIPDECRARRAEPAPAEKVYHLELVDAPQRHDGWPAPPAVIRLRRLLKTLLRGYGFRCISAREAPAAGQIDSELTP